MTDARNQAVDWAVKYIESGTGFLWLRDAFNAYCEEKASIELNPENLSFDIEETRRFLRQETWIKKITGKGANKITWKDFEDIVSEFLCKYYHTSPEEITSKEVKDILMIADGRIIRGHARVDIMASCHRYLDLQQLERLEKVLQRLVEKPDLTEEENN